MIQESVIRVFLSKALICFLGQCYPALVGKDTPTGEFQVEHVYVSDVRFGGDAILFKEGPDGAFAIHIPTTTRRDALLDAEDREPVTLGCINVKREVINRLLECCLDHPMVVEE